MASDVGACPRGPANIGMAPMMLSTPVREPDWIANDSGAVFLSRTAVELLRDLVRAPVPS